MTQENSKCWLCGDGDKIIYHIICKCKELTQKEYKTQLDWVGKMIPRELYKKVQIDQTIKWYIHKPEFVREKKTHKIIGENWDPVE